MSTFGRVLSFAIHKRSLVSKFEGSKPGNCRLLITTVDLCLLKILELDFVPLQQLAMFDNFRQKGDKITPPLLLIT